jgi:hypothetical protein
VKRCKACGDPITRLDERVSDLKELSLPVHAGEGRYCLECADELFRGRLSKTPAKLFSSGAGCPLEPNDDAGPWQENAIRDMEG